MKAALLLTANEPLSIEVLDPEPLGAHDVRVRIDASGVCHSDLSIATGLIPMPPPVILGHEGAGTVLEIGEQVTRVPTRRPGHLILHPHLWRMLVLRARPAELLRTAARRGHGPPQPACQRQARLRP